MIMAVVTRLVMDRIQASGFKTRRLSHVDDAALGGAPLVIAKGGEPVATLVPRETKRRTIAGLHAGAIPVLGDIVPSPQ